MKLSLDASISGLRRLFQGQDADAEGRKGSRAGWAIDTVDFSFLTLEEIIRTEPGSLGETLHIISLRSFKQALGEEWNQFAKKVQLIAESVVRRHLGRKGAAGMQDDDTFVLSFVSLPKPEADQLCRLIAIDFMKILIGERFADAAIRVGEVSRDRVLRGDGTLDLAAMDAAIDRATPNVLSAEGELVATAGALGIAAEEALDEATADSAAAVSAYLMSGRAASEPRWVSLAWPPPDLKRPQALAIPPVDPRDDVPEGLSLGFRPVWNAHHGRIDTYRVVPVMAAEDGGAGAVEAAFLPPRARLWSRLNRAFAVLFCALGQIERNIEARCAMELIVPIPFAATAMPARAILEDVLKYFPDPARARHLYLELMDVPDTVDDRTVAEAVRWLQGLCRDVLVSCDGADGGVVMPPLKAARPLAVGCDLSGRKVGDPKRFIPRFTKAIGPQGCYFWGLSGRTGFAAARAAGGLFVNGDAARPGDPTAAAILADPLAVAADIAVAAG